jgi:hypothetical protein
MMCPSVIIDNLDVRWPRRSIRPLETDAPLIVDADAVLPLAIALQRFEPVSRQRRQILKDVRGFEAIELEPSRPLDCRERLRVCRPRIQPSAYRGSRRSSNGL